MISDPNGNLLMQAQDEFHSIASMLTGEKQQLMDMGWSEENAESIVLEVLAQGGRNGD